MKTTSEKIIEKIQQFIVMHPDIIEFRMLLYQVEEIQQEAIENPALDARKTLVSIIGMDSVHIGLMEQMKAFHPDFIIIANSDEQEKIITKYTDMLKRNPFEDFTSLLPQIPVEQLKMHEWQHNGKLFDPPKSKYHK